jgi:hypothetical protein
MAKKNKVTSGSSHGSSYGSSYGKSTSTEKGWTKTKNSAVSYNKYKKNKGLLTNLNKAEKAYKNVGAFNAPYINQLNNTIKSIEDSKFEYDVNNDFMYNQYRDMYQGMGNAAMQEAQADATALTGGFANSYAQSAGQKAYNSYASQLQSIVPQLYSQARSVYDTDVANLYNKASLYSGLNAQSYTEYAAKLDQLANDRSYAYNKYWNNYTASAKTYTKETGKTKTYNKSKGKNSGRQSSRNSESSSSRSK